MFDSPGIGSKYDRKNLVSIRPAVVEWQEDPLPSPGVLIIVAIIVFVLVRHEEELLPRLWNTGMANRLYSFTVQPATTGRGILSDVNLAGAFVCLLLAVQAPELIRSLVLAEPPRAG